jgi:hypothetical protein
MQMVRLWCRVRRVTKVGELLESYVAQSDVVPRGSYQLHEPESVPREARQVLTQAVRDGQTWSCWAHGLHIWLFTCSVSATRSRECGAPVLQVSVYGDHGELHDCGTWVPDQTGKWRRGAAADDHDATHTPVDRSERSECGATSVASLQPRSAW